MLHSNSGGTGKEVPTSDSVFSPSVIGPGWPKMKLIGSHGQIQVYCVSCLSFIKVHCPIPKFDSKKKIILPCRLRVCQRTTYASMSKRTCTSHKNLKSLSSLFQCTRSGGEKVTHKTRHSMPQNSRTSRASLPENQLIYRTVLSSGEHSQESHGGVLDVVTRATHVQVQSL